MHTLPPPAASRHPRAGLSLLEVLVACGILAVGLASVSALLPAASARLGQATQQDRAGMLAANARAECVNRGLVAADIFSNGTLACVFGELRPLSAWPFTDGDKMAGMVTGTTSAAGQRAGTSTFQLAEDPSFRWGAMLARTGTAPASAAPGLPYTLSIAVFRKAPTFSRLSITLTGTSNSPLFRLRTSSTSGLADEATRRRFLPACSHVLTVENPPRWVRVTSSWTMPGFVVANGTITSGTEVPALRRSFVVLDPNPLRSGSTTINVMGFEGLLRVDQYPVTLE